MLMVGFAGTVLEAGSPFAAAVESGRVVNTVHFARNVASPGQLAALDASLQALSPVPMLIATDQEGGQVARLRPAQGFPAAVSAAELAALNNLDITRQRGATTARALAAAGINLNLAPVVDLNANPSNPVIGAIGRSFSASPGVVTDQALAFIAGHHDNGVLCTLKHFPGHGSSTADSHLGFVDVTETWSEVELEPFRRIIAAGQADAIMTAHIFNANLDPDLPATLSHATIEGVLRGDLGYDGVVITDDMQMGAISQYYGFEAALELAINAGADIIAIANMLAYDASAAPSAFTAILNAVNAGRIPTARIDQSYQRILKLKAKLA